MIAILKTGPGRHGKGLRLNFPLLLQRKNDALRCDSLELENDVLDIVLVNS